MFIVFTQKDIQDKKKLDPTLIFWVGMVKRSKICLIFVTLIKRAHRLQDGFSSIKS